MKLIFSKQALAMVLAHGMGAAMVFGQVPAAATGKPAIRFSEIAFDFGKVKPTDPQKHTFIVTNVGDAELEITEVKPGCGCTTAGDWDRKIAPGKTGSIPIAFNPANFSSTVGKSIMVTCNDPAQPSHVLSITATVWRPLDIQPQYTHFMPIEGETNADVRIVRITNNTEEELKLEAPESSNPQFKAELKNVKPGKEWEMTVSYVGPVTNSPPNGMITLKTSSAGTPQLSVSAYAMPQPAVTAQPPHIQLPAGPLGPNYNYPVAIRNAGRAAITISEPTVNVAGVTVKVQEATPGKLFNLSLNFPSDFKLEAGKSAELTVKTSHPKYPMLRVAIIQPAALPTGSPTPPLPQAIRAPSAAVKTK